MLQITISLSIETFYFCGADFNGVILVQNYLSRTGPEDWAKKVRGLLCLLEGVWIAFSCCTT